jgi:hypothetical protein
VRNRRQPFGRLACISFRPGAASGSSSSPFAITQTSRRGSNCLRMASSRRRVLTGVHVTLNRMIRTARSSRPRRHLCGTRRKGRVAAAFVGAGYKLKLSANADITDDARFTFSPSDDWRFNNILAVNAKLVSYRRRAPLTEIARRRFRPRVRLSASAMPRRLPRLRGFPGRALGRTLCVPRASLER